MREVLCVRWQSGQTVGGALERVQIFILAERLKFQFFLALSGRESSLVQSFCQFCEYFYLEIRDPRSYYLNW